MDKTPSLSPPGNARRGALLRWRRAPQNATINTTAGRPATWDELLCPAEQPHAEPAADHGPSPESDQVHDLGPFTRLGVLGHQVGDSRLTGGRPPSAV